MVRSFYNAGSGMLTQQRKLNAMSTNIANISTPGYKRNVVTDNPFAPHLITRIEQYNNALGPNIGNGNYIRTTDNVYSILENGALDETQRSVDMAILGEGFFLVRAENDMEYLTRNGQFEIDEEGYLVLPNVGRVQGEGGDIEVRNYDFAVQPDGNIYLDGENIDKLMIVVHTDPLNAKRTGEGLFIAENNYEEPDEPSFKIYQGYIERSNVDLADEMTKVISAQRAFQSSSQVLKAIDSMTAKAANEIGKK